MKPSQAKITNFFGVKRSLTTSVLPAGDAGSSGFLPPPPKRIKIVEDEDDDIITFSSTKKPEPLAPAGASSSSRDATESSKKPNESDENGISEPTEILDRPNETTKHHSSAISISSSSGSFGSRASSSLPKRAHTLMVIEDTGSLDEIDDYDSDNSEEAKIREMEDIKKNTVTDYELKEKQEMKAYARKVQKEFEEEEANAIRTHSETKKTIAPAPFQQKGGDGSASRLVREKILSDAGHRIQVRHGDITREHVGAIVNAANSALAHGGGVAGAISRAAGNQVQRESTEWVRRHGEVRTGFCALTGPGRLRCQKIIHAVGPVYTDGEHDEAELLHESVMHSLLMAEAEQLSSISIPAISSGIFGFPKDQCATIMFNATIQFLKQRPKTPVKEIRFCNFDMPTVTVFAEEFDSRFNSDS